MPTFRFPVALLLAIAPLAAQTRSTVLVGPPALGATCYVRHVLPAGSVGHVAGFLWSTPFAGAVAVPGLAVNGLLRVDPAALTLLAVSVTNGVDEPSMALPLPSSPTLLGNQLDCQSFDLDLASVFQLAGNDVAVVVVVGPTAALDMVAIAPGSFTMGSNAPLQVAPYYNDPYCTPAHQVTISRPFWIGKYEVTQAQFTAVMGFNPSRYQPSSPTWPGGAYSPQLPVEMVTWHQAAAYCQALTASEQAAGRVPAGYAYRLPTEAEWEYCCRAGTTTEYHYGATISCAEANFANDDQTGSLCIWSPWLLRTAPVGSYAPNAWGLHDMHGNVWEWLMDATDGHTAGPGGIVYGGRVYTAQPVTDPYHNVGTLRHFRGGSNFNYSRWLRSAWRGFNQPANVTPHQGFRVVLGPILP